MRRWIIGALAAAMLAAPAAAGPHPQDAFGQRIDELVAWIGANSDYPAQLKRHPAIVFLAREVLDEKFYEGSARGAYGRRDQIKAFYRDETIFLAEDFAAGEHDYILVHELVHHLQFVQARTFRCKAEQEREAYTLQTRFVAETGRGEVPNALFMAVLHCHRG